MRHFAAGGALAIILAACSTAGKALAGRAADCEAKGGTIQYAGLAGNEICVIPYKDAGKDCTDKADCEGECWVGNGGSKPGPDGVVHGECQPANVHFGCHAEIKAGKAGPEICID